MRMSACLSGVFWVALLFSCSLCQDNCRVQDGKAGEPGLRGRNGWPGQKGEKGEPGLQVVLSKEVLSRFKGDPGDFGPVGPPGPEGFSGEHGPRGLSGHPGSPGSPFVKSPHSSKAAFSVIWSMTSHPNYDRPFKFDNSKVLINVNKDFDVNTGYFTCKVPGVYYFVFHSVSNGNLCLRLCRDQPDVNLAFCDFEQGTSAHVLSGGAVFELAKGTKVWIEPFKNSDTSSETNTMSLNANNVFNGFLLFAK